MTDVAKQAKEALSKMKYEVANEIGVSLSEGDNGDNTAKQNGSVGGYMVKKMFDNYYSQKGV
ncbi:alpha/beta-type small acid-soluble spore protein [Eubacteriales bacterium OttesenSCG-928-M02]|nr:alpha/beta-type small acid-soluble spore protein [Eubacteriales bacterium OttesenSCG-928-M02]